jgi:aminopeptidase N
MIQQGINKQAYRIDPLLVSTLRNLLTKADVNKGILAEILTLPSENYLADLQGDEVNVDAIHQAMEALKTGLAAELQDELLDCYKHNQDAAEYRFDAEAVARRSLRNTVLAYLMQLDNEELVQLCEQQYRQANNMTDVIAALAYLANGEGERKQRVLDDFYQQWKHDPLVLDKWFAIQARSKAADTLERVQDLLGHEAFSIQNPNKVRSLIGSFAANPVYFHQADGQGYRFVAEQLLKLDTINPQVAARLLQAFSRWKRYDSKHRALMQEQLQRILSHEGLSSDCYEIASKSLA